MKFPKLDTVCSKEGFRLFQQYVKIEKEFTFATDAHIIVRHNTEEIFKKEFFDSIPDSGIAIHWKLIKRIREIQTTKIKLSEDKKMIELIRKDSFNMLFRLEDVNDIKFPPNFNDFFTAKKELSQIDSIALNANLLCILAEGMGATSEIIKLEFKGQDKNIYVSLNSGGEYACALGIIMPVMIQYN
jgi:hypothetical protein